MCLNPIAWNLRNNEGYVLTKLPETKMRHLLCVDDLKTFHKSPTKAMVETRKMEQMFKDIGLEWGLDKCSTVNVQRGKIIPFDELPLNEKDSISMLNADDQYKFLGKFQNSSHLDKMAFEHSSKEYIKRLSVIWSSNISIPGKIKATNTFAIPTLQYHMWTADWFISDLK